MAHQIIRFAKENNMKMRGHTFVWHNQMPKWFFKTKSGGTLSKRTTFKADENPYQTVVTHYKNDVYCWDVVNEAIEDKGKELLRNQNGWKSLGKNLLRKLLNLPMRPIRMPRCFITIIMNPIQKNGRKFILR